jgi:hypothetical protein
LVEINKHASYSTMIMVEDKKECNNLGNNGIESLESDDFPCTEDEIRHI